MLGKENALLVLIRKRGMLLERPAGDIFAFLNFADMRFILECFCIVLFTWRVALLHMCF
jgi:hypothetical protein